MICLLPRGLNTFVTFWLLPYNNCCHSFGTLRFLLIEKVNSSMDFHQKFSIALQLKDVKFFSFWLLFPYHCCHGTITHFMAIKTFLYCIAVCVFSWNFQYQLLPWQHFKICYYFIVFLCRDETSPKNPPRLLVNRYPARNRVLACFSMYSLHTVSRGEL